MRRQHKGLILGMVMMLALQVCMCAYAAPAKDMQANKNIVEVLKKNDKEFSTLSKALEAAGLTNALEGPGPLTVFAPTNRAFEQLPKGALETLLKPENKAQLTDILTYHVAQGKLPAEEVLKLDGKDLTMLNGKPAKIEVKNGTVYIDGAKVLKTDIQASNGVIHVIDTVLMPDK